MKFESWEKEVENIATWMKDYAKDAGTKGFVIGLSGGIDSSVIACLAVKAVGKENVIGVSLPCQTREDMKTDAIKLAKNLSIEFKTIELRKPYGELWNVLKMAHVEVDQFVLANIKARLRMTVLYAMAGAKNYLVIGTSNKSELMVGYFTKYGDGGIDIEPLGNYYKSHVYKMADTMPEIPNAVKVKTPTADLWDGQTDEQELGVTYDKLETILRRMEPYYTWHKVLLDTDGITEEEFMKIRGMIMKSNHKNETPPKYERE